ncbi:MAG: T9SS type A sorting domain-containing protein [Bacteroidota bacterium]
MPVYPFIFQNKFWVPLSALLFFTVSARAQSTLFEYTFNSDDEGWTAAGGFTRDNASFLGADGNHWRSTPFNDYLDNTTATVTSPVLDFTGALGMTFSFDVQYATEEEWDGMIVQYSTNSGSTWSTLGSVTTGTNWYNDTDVDAIANGQDGWSGINGAWETASISLPSEMEDITTGRIRVLFQTDGSIQEDGVAFDNVTITGTVLNFTPNTSVHPGNVSSNLTLWLRSDQDVSLQSTDQVVGWGDQSGNDNNALQLSGANTPTLRTDRVNGYPLLEFDVDFLDGDAGFYSREFFVVIDPDFISSSSEDTGDVLGFEVGDFSGLELGPSTSALTDEILTHTVGASTQYRSGYTDPGGTVALSNPILVNDRLNAGGNGQNIYLNGEQVDNAEANTGTFANFDNQPYRLGNDFENTDNYEGGFLEIVSYSSRLSDADRRDVATYLAVKYGITLDITSQAYTRGGTSLYNNTSYPNDIAGIGQDQTTMGLVQSQSTSVNPGTLITMSSPSAMVDGEYLLWGNNGLDNNFITSDVPNGVLQRLEKIWYVEETGDVGTVTVSVDLTDLGIDWRNSTVNLLTLNAGATIPADLATATVTSGGVVTTGNGITTLTFTGVDLPDGGYFTLGGDIQTTAPGGVSANLSLWLKADAGITANGTSVLAWSDLSGNGGDVTQGDPADQPTLVAGGMNQNDVLDFDGDFMDGLRGFSTQDYYIVLRPDLTISAANLNGFALGFEGGGFGGFYLGGETDGFIANDIATHAYQDYRQAYADGAATLSDPAYIFNVRNNSGGTSFEVLANGLGINNSENTTNFGNVTNSFFRVGDNFINTRGYGGQIAEIICYTARNSDADRRDIETYLALKYGIALDISSLGYTLNGSDIYNYTTHATNISGIGYNLDHGFLQSNSMSLSSDAMVGMSSPNAFDTGDYLIWGRDGGSVTTPQTTELPNLLHERLPAEWRVGHTGDVGTVTVRVYVGGLDNYADRSTNPAGYTLLTNSTGDFNSATQYSGSTISGDTVYFTGVTFADGDYFTLSVPPVLNPGGIAGGTLWLRADKGVTVDGSDVTIWTNQISGAGVTEVRQNTVAARPSRVLDVMNGQPVIRYDNSGTADFLQSDGAVAGSTLFSTNANTAFYVGAHSSNGRIYDWRNSGSERTYLGVNGGAFRYVIPNTTTGLTNGATGLTQDDTYIATGQMSGGNNNVYLNGGTSDGNATTVGTLNTALTSVFRLGQNHSGGGNYSGDMGEVILFDQAISSDDRRQVETYLALKYGVGLDMSGGNYVVTGNTLYSATSYGNDVVGIGFDALLDLDLQSGTTSNDSDIVTMSNPSALGQGDFLLWGHDGGALTSTVSGLPAGATERLTRQWGVQQTNTPGTVTVNFNLTGLGFGAYSLQGFLLVIDDDNDFSNGVLRTIPAQQFASDIVTFVGANFSGATHFGLITDSNLSLDSDSDGAPDYVEVAYGTDPNNGNAPVNPGAPSVDTDASTGINGDGISDALEFILANNGGTAPITRITDSDGDGISDWREVSLGSDPFGANSPSTSGNTDTDGDGIPDGLETLITSLNGGAAADLSTDTDGDGVPDYYEVLNANDPNDANDPQSGGGSAADSQDGTGASGDNISDAMEVILIAGGATGPISTTTDTDGDGIPDYIEAQTNTDPFNSNSPALPSSLTVRSLQADYSVTGGTCVDLNGYQWVNVTDNTGRLVFSINPVGNNLGSTCWGVRIVTGSGSVRTSSDDYALNRNWWIEPTTQPTGFPVYVRYYVLNQEFSDIHTRLQSDGHTPAALETYISGQVSLVKTSGVQSLDPFPGAGTESTLSWSLGSFGSNSRTITAGYPSFSSTRMQTNAISSLPIELLYFRAETEEEAVRLQWQTAWERDNDFFTIERKDEFGTWQEVAEIPGAGFDADGRSYSHNDVPNSGANTLWYRLKQTDYDGTYTYSDPVAVVWEPGQVWPVYPNPTQNEVSIRLTHELADLAEVRLLTLDGQTVPVEVRVDGTLLHLSVGHLATGLYMLETVTPSHRQVTRLWIKP